MGVEFIFSSILFLYQTIRKPIKLQSKVIWAYIDNKKKINKRMKFDYDANFLLLSCAKEKNLDFS